MQDSESLLDRLKRKTVPLSIYWLKDFIRDVLEYKNFHDSLATTFAYISLGIAFPLFPAPVFVPLSILVFASTFIHPLLGLMALLLLTLPLIIYQAPLLAWMFMVLVSASLFLGYKHYRSIAYGYALVALALSYLGFLLEIPALVLATLVLGFKRSAVIGTIAILVIVVFSFIANIPVSGPIVFNSVIGHQLIRNLTFASYFEVAKPAADLGGLGGALAASFSTLFSQPVANNVLNIFYYALVAIGYKIEFTLLQILIWLFVAYSISSYAISSRSAFKGTLSSLFGAILPLSAFIIAPFVGLQFNPLLVLSFLITPLLVFAMEASNIEVVQALDVMKQDILGKFGVAFEDLTKGSSETLADVANYDQTKEELRQAILLPTEHREISGAYKVKPAKGILLFGPPGTGKTLIMRALANEVRASFFYVNGGSLLSPYPGEASQALSRIFATAKKHTPCILFFDEIDSIAGRRDTRQSQSGSELITTLLSEMDGFQKISGVVVVGATNTPQALDPGIMRPGRFDKIIFVPLPDQLARSKIFKHYLASLPIGKDIDYTKLGSITSRFSAADIKNVCEEVSREVGEKAISKREVLVIKMADAVRVIKGTKPSTTISQLEEYNTFRIDYERRMHPENQIQDETKVDITDVVGLDEAKKALHEAVEIPLMHPELLKKYDISDIKGILLFGPPGTGKTMLLQAIANELGEVHVLTVSGYDLSKYGIERASASIKEIFDRARENAPAIIFVDEIDAIMPARDQASETSIQLTGEFLQEFDKISKSSGVVVVAATNRPDTLDPAVLRAGRFDKLVYTPPPNKEGRARLFQLNLEKAPVANDVSFDALADITEDFTGADIANICRQAKLNALEASLSSEKEVKISMKDISTLIRKMRASAPSAVISRYLTFFSKYGKR